MGYLKFNSKKINKRKIFGTIVGIAFWTACILFFTYAYYEWKSTNTSVVIGIEDVTMKCLPGTDVNVDNIGPVFDYRDGIKSNFSIQNETDKSMAIDLRLDIESISDSLLTKSFKYMLFTDTTGGTNYDYDNPILIGSFKEFSIGSNIIVTALEVLPSITQSFEFIVFIDGNMKNDISMQENSMVSNLLIGNCDEDFKNMDSMIYQAIYSSDAQSLMFVHTTPVEVGTAYNGKRVDAVYTGFDTSIYSNYTSIPWYKDGTYDDITTVIFESVIAPKSTAYWFYEFKELSNIIGLDKLDTSNVTNMNWMFAVCSNLVSLDLSSFDVSNVTNMNAMFHNCGSLSSIDFGNFKTNKVINMASMFNLCRNLTNLDLSSFNTSSVTDMGTMFQNCTNLVSVILSSFNTNNVTTMKALFNGCKKLTSLDLSNFNTSKVISMENMFRDCSSLVNLNISGFDTGNVKSMNFMFYNCSSLIELDISNFDTSNVTNMNSMFYNCSSLTQIDVSNFDTANVNSFNSMFAGCSSLASLNLSNFDTSSATDLGGLFAECNSLITLNLSNFNTNNVTIMSRMFYNCYGLISIDFGNISTSSVTTMADMFYKCSSLTTLDLSKFDTSSVTATNGMFSGCSSLVSLDLSNANFNNVTGSYNNMFLRVPNNTIIFVKDNTQVEWITSKFANLTNIIVSS